VSARSRQTFQQLVTLPDSAIPLAEAALLMACEEYPQLEISPYLDQLDRMAHMAQESLRGADTPVQTVEKINAVLFETLGFRGNTEDYYDPRNSFFNDVIDRRIGIPITLSTVYMEVSRRLKFPISGVGMPGHFVVKFNNRSEEFFLDPFNRGMILTRDDCRARIQERYGDSLEFDERLLERVTNRQILARMLNNLKLIYLKAQAFDKGLAIVDMMLMVNPNDIEQFRDRGLLRLQLRQFEGAARDLKYYLRKSANCQDREEIEDHLKELRRIQAMMN
jgi:regulator of sirC expression with transglutaminase-like and TPR domain